MKSSISAYTLFVIVITFIVLFTGYICITINQSKAFSVKNKIVNIIEKYKEDFPEHIPETLDEVGYRNTGRCPDDENINGTSYSYVGYRRDGSITSDPDDIAVCVLAVPNNNGTVEGYYYKVVTFYQLDLPIIRSIFQLTSKGETKTLYSTESFTEY